MHMDPLQCGTMLEGVGRLVLAQVTIKHMKITVASVCMWVGIKQGPANLDALSDLKQTLGMLWLL